MDLKKFGARLRELRIRAGMTQTELADAAEVSQNGLSHWETGSREPGWSTIVKLADALGVSCEEFREKPAPKRGRKKK